MEGEGERQHLDRLFQALDHSIAKVEGTRDEDDSRVHNEGLQMKTDDISLEVTEESLSADTGDVNDVFSSHYYVKEKQKYQKPESSRQEVTTKTSGGSEAYSRPSSNAITDSESAQSTTTVPKQPMKFEQYSHSLKQQDSGNAEHVADDDEFDFDVDALAKQNETSATGSGNEGNLQGTASATGISGQTKQDDSTVIPHTQVFSNEVEEEERDQSETEENVPAESDAGEAANANKENENAPQDEEGDGDLAESALASLSEVRKEVSSSSSKKTSGDKSAENAPSESEIEATFTSVAKEPLTSLTEDAEEEEDESTDSENEEVLDSGGNGDAETKQKDSHVKLDEFGKSDEHIGYQTAIEYMTRIDVLATAGDTSWVSLPPAPPKFSCIPFLCTGARLKAPLYEQYYQVVRLSKIQYSSMDEHHHDIMSTLFTKVTGRSKYQTDWKMFGFQNVDFSTDLRGVGMLGPLQMLWLSENYPVIAKEWLTADDPESGKVYYPFALQSLSMTSYSLRALRQGRLNKLCNSKGDVMLVLNQYYAGLFKQFIKLFREKGVAEEYAGVVGKEVADKFIADPEGCIKTLHN